MKRSVGAASLILILAAGCGQNQRPTEDELAAADATQEAEIQRFIEEFDAAAPKPAEPSEAEAAPDAAPRPAPSETAGDPASPQGAPAGSMPVAPNVGTLAEVSEDDSVAPPVDPRLLAAAETPAQQPEKKEPLVIPKAERGRDGRFDIAFDHIKFEMDKDAPFDRSLFTDQVEMLFGEPIRIRGYIHPSGAFYQELNQFVLVRDNQECCFGPGAALYDCIMVKMKPGKTATYTVRPITVEGIFLFNEMKDPFDETKTVAIYELQADSVR